MYNKINVIRHQESRECICCGKQWNIWVNKTSSGSKKRLFCDECNATLSGTEKLRLKRLKVEGFHDKELLQRKLSHRRNYIHEMIINARKRARKHNLEFNLTDNDIVIPKMCPLLNVPFVLGEKANYEYTPTIDRIDNSKGYTKDNIWIITKKANSMKNSASFSELKTFCTNILRYSLNNKEKELVEQENKETLG